jgi:hypothetical protein
VRARTATSTAAATTTARAVNDLDTTTMWTSPSCAVKYRDEATKI